MDVRLDFVGVAKQDNHNGGIVCFAIDIGICGEQLGVKITSERFGGSSIGGGEGFVETEEESVESGVDGIGVVKIGNIDGAAVTLSDAKTIVVVIVGRVGDVEIDHK